ncbi:MAG: GAF domain-containing protein [Anaerolineales bacterium]|nr:GAF domain-containing protein [Anaerolineales bacterium]
MTTSQTTPTLDAKQKRFKGSLAGTLVRTLLVFTFIPFAAMAGAAYFRARALLREQAVVQFQNLLETQIQTVDAEIKNKDYQLKRLLDKSDYKLLVELGLHANPQRQTEFNQIRADLLRGFESMNAQEESPSFNNFILMDYKGNIKVSSNPEWQGVAIDPSIFDQISGESPSAALYNLPPLYENKFIFVTAVQYKTARGSTLGMLVGVTEGKNLQRMTQPINGLSPLADTYFILPSGQALYNDPNSREFLLADSSAPSQVKIASKLSELIAKNELTPNAMDVATSKGEAALAQIQWLPSMRSGIVLEVKETEVYGQLTSLAPFTGILIFFTLIATAVVLTLGINRVIKPLRSLSNITQRFAEGNWEQRAEVLSDDEVGFLASSFNLMADELRGTYRQLEQKVDERARQIQTAAEVAQSFTTLSNLDEMLNSTVELLIKQFDFYQASVFLLDRSGKYLEFRAGFGAATQGLKEKNYRLEVGSASIMGWVSANGQPRVTSDVSEDEFHLKNELLPETRSEATLPISMNNLVLGVLDVQSAQEDAFGHETVVMLQTLASQLATAIQTAGLTEISQIDFEELARLYRSSRLIAEANTENEIFEIGEQILKEAPYIVALLRAQDETLEIYSSSDETKVGAPLESLPKHIPVRMEEIEKYLSRGPIIATPKIDESPNALKNLAQKIGLESAAYLPIRKNGELAAIMMIGIRQGILVSAALQPYTSLAELMTVSMDRADAIQQTEKHLREVESLASINEAISKSANLQDFFQSLHRKIQDVIGNYNLIVALYDAKTNTISVPFSYEDGRVLAIESFPMGEGLTSILIRSRQPLMLVEDTERRTADLGAKIVGKAARSWMGAPMLIQNEPIGALILQDTENEHAFDEDDLKFFTTITGQVAGVIHNVHLLEESQRIAVQLESAAEIARDISGLLNIDELLIKAVNLIRERFNFYHASVFLHDLSGEFAVIREASGEAGAQMKRAGYKIGIGSKSIVGFVGSRGEQLVINDTARDATYYANPLFPETRAEAAIPLKVGERILGVLDVQSSQPYAFSEESVRSLKILADQIAVAVVNTELFAETQEHLSQHRLLHHITTTVASGTTLDEALESAVSGLQVTLGGDRVIILLADSEKEALEVKASVGYAEDITDLRVTVGEGIIGWAAAHRKPLRIKDVRLDPRYHEISSNTRSELALPLIYRNELLGVLNVESEQVDAYAENDEEMLGTLGGSLAAIIANARLLEQIRQQAERERVVHEVSSKIRRSTDIQSIMMTTASELARITGARYAKLQVKPEQSKGQEGS